MRTLYKKLRKNLFVLILLVSVIGAASLLAKQLSVTAATQQPLTYPATPNSFPGVIKDGINVYNSGCQNQPEKYSNLSWPSAGWDYSQTGTIFVEKETTEVPLKMNYAVFLCHTLVNQSSPGLYLGLEGLPTDHPPTAAAALSNSYQYIENAEILEGGGKLIPSPANSLLNIGKVSNSRYWMGGAGIDFTWIPGEAIKEDTTIRIRLTTQVVNKFGASTYGCVNGGAPASGPPPNDCPRDYPEIALAINVQGGSNDEFDYDHVATINCSLNTPTAKPNTIVSCAAGMRNEGNAKGPATAVELYEYKQQGQRTECLQPVPGPEDDGKLTGYYGCINGDMISGDPAQEHFVWVRSETPYVPKPDSAPTYEPAKFKIKPGTPDGTKLCFATKVTASPYTSGNTVHTDPPYCVIVGNPPCPNGNCGGGDPVVDPPPLACKQANTHISGFPDVSFNLPDLRSYPAGSASQPAGGSGTNKTGFPSLPGQVYQDVNQANPFRINSAKDEWGQSTSTTASVGSRSNNPFTLSYQPFIEDYPYDFHSPQVNYTQYYTRHTWAASFDSMSAVYTPPVPEKKECTTDEDGEETCVITQAFKPGFTTYTWSWSYKDSTSSHSPSNTISPNTGGL